MELNQQLFPIGDDSDSCSIISLSESDFSDLEEDDGDSVVTSQNESSESDTESSCGFFSDEDQNLLDENWNESSGGESSTNHAANQSRKNSGDFILPGKCTLCVNLEGVCEADLEERCQSPSSQQWCKCGGKCRVVSYHMKKYDRICCHELAGVVNFIQSESSSNGQEQHLQCITMHNNFQTQVLEYGALYRTSHPNSKIFDKTGSPHNAANWSFILWIWDKLGYGNQRIMPPACVIAKIREVHMKDAPFWYYHNFIPGKYRCEYGKHCVPALADTYNIK